MRRTLVVLAVLLVALVAGDQVLRARVAGEVERAAASAFAAAEADADVTGLLVLPQLLAGALDRVDVEVTDGVVGDPPIRVVILTASLEGVAVGFPPPTGLDEVDVAGGTLTLTIHEREVERLIRAERPGWSARITPEGVVATGTVEGADVRVTAEAVVDGTALHLRATEVDAGALGSGAADLVAAAFETSIPFAGVPENVRFTAATTATGRLVIEGTLAPGTLRLAG